MNCVAFLASYLMLIICMITLVESSGVRTRTRALYGEFCDNRVIRCDTSLSLSCNTSLSLCVCLKPEHMIYDKVRGSCAALAGEKCRFTVLDEYRSWQEEIVCVNNAHCDFTQSVCKCDRDFLELSNGTCIPKKTYMESCETTIDCKQDLSLICENSTCVCNPAISEYNDELFSCVGLAGHPCVNDQCVANAICREETPRRAYYEESSEETAEEEYGEGRSHRDPASIGRCQCRTAFGVTSDGRCQLGYGGKCDHVQAKCMAWFKCKEGTCVCQYPTHQVYDKNVEACLSYVGGPCTNPELALGSNQTKIDCISGAICSRQGESSRFQCSCPPGYIENGQRGCDLDFGQNCRTVTSSYTTRHNSLPSPPKCDSIGKLFCINGRCQCEDDLHVYDKASRSCKGLVGATCTVKQKGECIVGSYCQSRRAGITSGSNEGVIDGICTCQDFYREGDDRTCSPKAQQPSSQIALKSGGTDIRRGVDAKFNSTANSIWAIFDHNEEDD